MGPSATRAMRLQMIDAMERRAAGLEGEARRLVDEKRSRLIEASVDTDHVDTEVCTGAPGREALQQLANSQGAHATFPALPALEGFRKTWAALHAERQLRQTLEYVPENAGPLNSSALVHRSIELMRELSPGYLRHFLAYVDDLSWMERMTSSGILAEKGAPQAASIGKRSRAKARGRR